MSPKARSPVAFGGYIITRRIARGGMAEIYRARTRGADVDETRWVALKLMRSSLGHEELRLRLFEREARIASRLNHDNVVPVFEFGQEMGRPFLAMEYVLGRDLSHLLKSEKKGRDIVDFRLGLYVGLLAARGLGHAHRLTDEAGAPLGIVHRDISPGNVMIGYQGEVKVLDFGVARMNETQGFHTQTGTLRGKFAYMSPEQTLGEDLDARSDVFSFGTVLYELLTGINCFRAANPIATLERVQGLRPVPPSRVNRDIPKTVDKILARCLAKDRRRRFKDAVALAEAIEAFLHSQGYRGHEALVAHMEKEFSWEKHEETSELTREEEEVALFDVVDFALLSNTHDLDAKNLAVSTEEEASQSEVQNVAQRSDDGQPGVFEGDAEPASGESEAPKPPPPQPDPDFYEEAEDATIASPEPLAFEDQAHEAGAQVEMASLLAETPEAADPAEAAPAAAAPVTRAEPPAPEALAPPPARRRGVGLWLAAVAVVLAAGFGAFALSRGDRAATPARAQAPTKLEPVRITLGGSDKAPAPAPTARVEARRPPAPDTEAVDLPEGDGRPEAPARAAPEAARAAVKAPPRAAPSKAPAPRRVVVDVAAKRPSRVRKAAARPRPRPKTKRPKRGKKGLVGYLNVGAKPWAEIQIDGKPWPYQTPQAGIELKTGKHRITLHNPDTGVTRSTAVYIKAGAYRTVMMDMRKNR